MAIFFSLPLAMVPGIDERISQVRQILHGLIGRLGRATEEPNFREQFMHLLRAGSNTHRTRSACTHVSTHGRFFCLALNCVLLI